MTKELKVSKIQQWLNDQQQMLDRGIVATPTEEYLESDLLQRITDLWIYY